MTNGSDANSSLAVLIDADNANPSIIEGLLAEVAKLGLASVKRIYGDWTTPDLGSAFRIFHPADPTIQVYDGKECDR